MLQKASLGFFHFFLGMYHSLYIFIRLFKRNNNALDDSDNIKKQHARIQSNIKLFCLVNGLVFLTCVCYIDYIIMPTIYMITNRILWESCQQIVYSFIDNGFKVLILYLWTLSTLFFFTIFQILKFGSKNGEKKSIFKICFNALTSTLSKAIDISTVFTFECIILVESMLMLLIPLEWLSKFLFHIQFSFFLSFMIFDYKWSLMSWSIKDKIDFIESRCTYFLGFGLVLSMLFLLPGSLIYNVSFSTFFIPIVIYNAIETKCEHLEPVKIRFPVFDFQFSFFIFFLKKFVGSNANAEKLKMY